MTRPLIAAILASGVALALGACGDDSPSGYASGYGGGSGNACSSYTTCGTCTPANGCGWCFNGSTGACASSPDQCYDSTNLSEFTWTWDPAGCPDVDASVLPLSDAAAPPPTTDAGTTTTPEAAAPEAAAPEAAPPTTDAGPDAPAAQ
jgi:hypothetical protein